MKAKPGAIILVICLILLPFISWLYLDRGLKLRLTGLDQMRITEAVDTTLSGALAADSIVNKVSILMWLDSLPAGQSKKIIETIYNQNDGSRVIQVLACTGGDIRDIQLPAYYYKAPFVKKVDCKVLNDFRNSLTKTDSLLSPGISGFNALVIDKKMQVRKVYQLNDSDEVRMLIKHSAILIPERKRLTPKLVRQKPDE